MLENHVDSNRARVLAVDQTSGKSKVRLLPVGCKILNASDMKKHTISEHTLGLSTSVTAVTVNLMQSEKKANKRAKRCQCDASVAAHRGIGHDD